MSYLSRTEQELLAESYQSINIKQVILESAAETFINRAAEGEFTLAESRAILDIYDSLVEEGLFGGIANAAKGIGGTLQRGAQAVGQGARQGAQAVGQGMRTAGQMAGAASRQIGQNVSNMYQTGSTASDVAGIQKKAKVAADQLVGLLNQVKELSPETFTDNQGRSLAQNVMNLPLGSIITYLAKAGANTAGAATAARDKGVFGGVGGAVKSAYQGGAAPTPATP